MRKLVIAQFISLDGVVEAPDAWHFPYVNDEMFARMWSVGAGADTMLLGRVTYDSYAGAFAHAPAGDDVAGRLTRQAKVVVTRTPRDLEWANSRPLADELVAGVRRLKEQPGGDILVTGSISVSRALLRAGLVDELHLLVHPIVVGAGERLFEAGGPQVHLTLASSTPTSLGVLSNVYAVA